MSNFLSKYPDQDQLIRMYPDVVVKDVNAHIHTPYSFSAFTDISQVFEMARLEKISALGINDFFVTDGYEPFHDASLINNIFPLFNIEFIALLREEQQAGKRVNDPNNPGRCYFCGKGLDYPFRLNNAPLAKLASVVEESQEQVRTMLVKLNEWFRKTGAGIELNFEDIRVRYAKNLVRERHLAKAVRIAVFEKFTDETHRKNLFMRIFGGRTPGSGMDDLAGLENEIRSILLKAGGKAFVEEDESAFLDLGQLIDIIIDAGGIPCYPVLLDDRNGHYTEYEQNYEELYRELLNRNIGCIELIPGRNDADHLHKFVEYFDRQGFVILMGTEHNTPEMIPLTCTSRGNKPLDNYLRRISYEGACVVAAHQYMRARDQKGYVNTRGIPAMHDRHAYVALGNAVIHYTNAHYKA
jgi:hypothetical protein